MLQVCPCNSANSASVSNSSYISFMNNESSIVSHMELTLYKNTCDNKTLKKTVFIFIGYEYTFTYYDYTENKLKTITGIVDAINGDNSNIYNQSLTVTYLVNPGSLNSSDEIAVTRGPVCSCIINKPNTDKYNTTAVVTVLASSISDVQYTGIPEKPGPNKPSKKGVEVVLLGISAEFVRAVAINLKMIDDCSDKAVKDIYMKVGGIYNVAYIDPIEKAMYEIEGKLLSISETTVDASSSTIVHDTTVNEQCGLNNSIYNSGCSCESCSSTDKDKYMTSDNIQKEVLLTLDCSTDFSGHYHTIRLSTIRDCTVIDESDVDIIPGSDNSATNCNCGCNDPIEMQCGNTKVVVNPVTQQVTYSGGKCSFGKVTLQEVMDYYFGT